MSRENPAGDFVSRRLAAEIIRIDVRRLRRYEQMGLVRPARHEAGESYYSEPELARLRRIQRLIEHCGLNLAGVEVVLRLTEEMEAWRREAEAEIAELRRRLAGS